MKTLETATPAARLQLVLKLAPAEQLFAKVTRGDLAGTLVELGTLEPWAISDIVCPVKAKPKERFATVIRWVVEDGEMVRRGDKLIEFEQGDLPEKRKVQQEAVELAEAALAFAKSDLEKTRKTAAALGLASAEKELRLREAIARQERSRLRELDEELGHRTMTAPRDGLVVYWWPEGRVFRPPGPIVAVGEPVREGQKLVRVLDVSKLLVRTRVAETHVGSLRPGQAASVRVHAFAKERFAAKVLEVAKVAEATPIRTPVPVYPVTVALEKALPSLKPGMSAEVSLTVKRKGALYVPETAVFGKGKQYRGRFCYVRDGDTLVERPVRLGMSSKDHLEITEGLREGDLVLRDPHRLGKPTK